MSRFTARTIATAGTLVALVGGGAAVYAGTSHAAEDCGALDIALASNQSFIAGQRANPDALSGDRIANRQAVVDLIQSRRADAGCNGAPAAPQTPTSPQAPAVQPPAAPPAAAQPPAAPPAANDGANNNAGRGNAGRGNAGNTDGAAAGEQVCNGSTVTVSGEGGAPGAASNQFPVGTRLSITNLDNNRSTTVSVTSVSGSCFLLNNAAFEQVREAGKFVIRRAVIRRA